MSQDADKNKSTFSLGIGVDPNNPSSSQSTFGVSAQDFGLSNSSSALPSVSMDGTIFGVSSQSHSTTANPFTFGLSGNLADGKFFAGSNPFSSLDNNPFSLDFSRGTMTGNGAYEHVLQKQADVVGGEGPRLQVDDGNGCEIIGTQWILSRPGEGGSDSNSEFGGGGSHEVYKLHCPGREDNPNFSVPTGNTFSF